MPNQTGWLTRVVRQSEPSGRTLKPCFNQLNVQKKRPWQLWNNAPFAVVWTTPFFAVVGNNAVWRIRQPPCFVVQSKTPVVSSFSEKKASSVKDDSQTKAGYL